MKKKNTIILCLILVLLLVVSSVIHAFAVTINISDGFKYSIDTNTTATLYGRTTDSSDVVIPNSLDGYYITSIADSAFENDTAVNSLDLTQALQLTSIGFYSFKGCSELSGEIILRERLGNLGYSAFEDCSNLESVIVYSTSLKVMTDQCFYKCSSLKNVVLSNSVTTISKLAFANCTSLETITIPASVISISPSAFINDDDLVIKCYYGSYAAQFAEDNGIEYEILDPWNIPTEPPTEPQTDEPTEPATDEPTTEPETFAPGTSYIVGDADHDGKITVLDATAIQKCLAVLISDDDGWIHMAGSVDGLTLNVTHATYVQKYLASIPVNYPIGEERLIPTE